MNKTLLSAFITALFAIQACSSSSHTETSEVKEVGPLSNDPNTEVRSKDKKFLCDFEWTPGYNDWDYSFGGDKPIGELGSAKESWCLIPYGESTEYEITIQSPVEGYNKPVHYFCRDVNSTYTIANESTFAIEDGAHNDMKCAELNSNSTIAITAKTSDTPHKDERLYHIIHETGERYTITGHLNFRLVRLVQLNVLISFIDDDGFNINDGKTIVNYLKSYMKKAGYALNTVDELQRVNTTTNMNSTNTNTVFRPFLISFLENIIFDSNYDRLIGVRYEAGAEKKMISNDNNSSVTVILDNDFFKETLEKRARLLASLLYSPMLQMIPTYKNDIYQNDSYLSYYTTNLNFSQPSRDWKAGRNKGKNQQGSLLEFASIMQHFIGE